MRIPYGIGAYRRDNGSLPELRLVNMFVEAAPLEGASAVLLSRKGLTEHSDVGTGPVKGLFRADGVFNGDLFRVSGGSLYRNSTLLGTIVGTGPVSFAASDTELAICAGSTLYRYDSANGLDAVSFPDGRAVIKILFHDGLFIAITEDRYYWSSVLDADTWNALDFASAERKPDPNRDAMILNDTLWIFGSETVEPNANTGDADAPYQRFEQRIFTKGAHSTGDVAEFDNSLGFVGSDGMVYRMTDEGPQRISDHGIEERIEGSATVSAFSFIAEGHSFLCLRLDAGTFAYDAATQQWCELASYGRVNFRGQCVAMGGSVAMFGDDETGQVWTLDGYDDDGETETRLFTAGFPINGGTVTVDNLIVEANVGRTDVLTGQGSAPQIEMRSSRDGGATWGNWKPAYLGEQGSYRTKTVWRRCGMFDAPCALFEFRVTDPVPLRVSGVYVNEAGGGRSR